MHHFFFTIFLGKRISGILLQYPHKYSSCYCMASKL